MGKLKKIVAVLMAAATVSALSVSAFAVSNQDTIYFDLDGRGDSDWSSRAEKKNSLSYASLYTEYGMISSSNPIYIAIFKEKTAIDENMLSHTLTITKPYTDAGEEYIFNYMVTRGHGSYSYLHATSGYYGVSVGGHWYA